jgi:hypothetical protein
MRRAFLAASALLFCGAIAAREKAEPIVFVFLRVDRGQGVAFLRPMIAPDIGVQLVSGPPKLEPGTVLRCEPSTHAQSAIVEGQVASISELVLACDEHKFIVKGLDFSKRAN